MPPEGRYANLKSILGMVAQAAFVVLAFAFLLRLLAAPAGAANTTDLLYSQGGAAGFNFGRPTSFQEFTPTVNRLSGLGLEFNVIDPGELATATIELCLGDYVDYNTCDLVYLESGITAAYNRTEGINYWQSYIFDHQITVTPGQKYFFKIYSASTTDPWNGVFKRTADIYADHISGGWEAGFASYVTSNDDYGFETYYDTDAATTNQAGSVIIQDDALYYERHHLIFAPQNYCQITGEPCYLKFKYNQLAEDDIVYLYNTVDNLGLEPTGSRIASTSILDSFGGNGQLTVPYTATTTDGVIAHGRYCAKAIDVYGDQPDELTCGIEVIFFDADTWSCLWATTEYNLQHDAGTLCSDIATSSIWEAGSWPGAMTCAGREISYWLFTATSSAYFDLCAARADTDRVFPISLINDLKNVINTMAATSAPTSTALMPMLWANPGQPLQAATSADFLSAEKLQTDMGSLFTSYYDTIELILWLGTVIYIIFQFLGWHRQEENREVAQITNAGRAAGERLRRSKILGRPARYP